MLTAILTRLLWREKLPAHVTLHPEERLSIEVANMLRKESIEGNLKAVWTHVANESKRHRITALVLKAMGLISGALDFFFIGSHNSGLIELKSSTGRLSENQKLYIAWALSLGVPHAVCRTVDEVRDTLIAWGLLTERPR
jgi:hypothetical protein